MLISTMSRILFLMSVLFLFGLAACSSKGKHTTKVVKPKYHHRWFDRKKDKRVKRIRTVRVVS